MAESLRITHLVHQYVPEHLGGTELITQQLVQQQVARGYAVRVVVPTATIAEGYVRETLDGAEVFRVGVGQRGRTRVLVDNFFRPKLRHSLLPHLIDSDIVHIQHLMGIPIDVALDLAQANVPYIITLHDYWYPCANAQLITNYDESVCYTGPDAHWRNCGRCFFARGGLGDRPLLARTVAPLLKMRHQRLTPILQHAAAVIAPTDFVRNIYRENGMGTDNLVVVRHGIHYSAEMQAPKQVNQTDAPLHVAYIGSIAFQKGVHILIEAFNKLPSDRAKLTIAGGLNSFPDYANQLRQQATHPHIEFVGKLDRAEVWKLMQSADVVVLPTLWYESSSLVLDEAFATGTPVIAANIGVMTEKVRHEVDGLLVEVGNSAELTAALNRLLNNPDLLTQLSNNTPIVRTIQQHTDEIEQVYLKIKQR